MPNQPDDIAGKSLWCCKPARKPNLTRVHRRATASSQNKFFPKCSLIPCLVESLFPFVLYMANPKGVIADAFEKLRRSISEEDAKKFASTNLKDVWSAVREIDDTHRRRQSAQNLRRVEPLLTGLEKYSKVIEVLCNGTPYMPYVWVCYPILTRGRDSLTVSRLRSSWCFRSARYPNIEFVLMLHSACEGPPWCVRSTP